MRARLAALAAGVAGILALAVAVPPSAASWRDQEWVTAPVRTLECGTLGTVDTTAWGRVVTGTVGGQSLDPVAAIGGITVRNSGSASTASSPAATTSLGSDAWTSSLALTALSGLTVGGGVTLPVGANTGSYTQYGRATSSGLAVGASGAVTSAGSGVVALEQPGSATPRLAELRLSDLVGASLPNGVTTAQLADARLRVGALGAIASYDSCDTLWSGSSADAALVREYVIGDLGLDFSSSVVSGFSTGLVQSLTTLETDLDALLAPGTSVTGAALTSLTSSLASATNLTVLGVQLSLAQVNSIKAGIDVDLAPVRALVAGQIGDGVVTVNLTTGRITADLDALFDAAYGHSGGLNGLGPNTRVLTPQVLGELSRRVGVVLQSFATGTIKPALDAALAAATVTVVIDATLRTRAALINVLGLRTVVTITGTPASFTTGTPAPTVSVVASEASFGILGALLSLLGLNLTSLIGGVQTALVAPLVSTVVPTLGSTVVAPTMALATGLVTTSMGTLTGTTIPQVLTSLAPVLSAVDGLLDLTVNARPDVAANSVGPPASAASGRYFETALHVGVVDGGSTTVASLYLGNASVGPNLLR